MSTVDEIEWTITKPPASLSCHIDTVRKGTVFYRVHNAKFRSMDFNPGYGNARFSPIKDIKGTQIPTIYAGDSVRVALMESIFHDIPHVPGFKSYDKSKLIGQVISKIRIEKNLSMVKVSSPATRKLGIPDAELIHSMPNIYPQTRAWAEAIHRSAEQAQGLVWTSRQESGGKAIILFGDRECHDSYSTLNESQPITPSSLYYKDLKSLADEMDVYLTD